MLQAQIARNLPQALSGLSQTIALTQRQRRLQYPARAADRIFEKVSGAEGVDKYTTEVTQDSFLMSTLGFLLPMLIFFVT